MSDNIRQKQFKNNSKHEEMRRRRAEGSLELRKQRKDEQLMKRRNVDVDDQSATTEDETMGVTGQAGQDGAKITTLLSLKDCFTIFKTSADFEKRYQAVESIRRHMSRQKNPPIDDVIKMGMLPYLIEMLSGPSTKLQFEAAWALTNVTSGNAAQTMAAVNDGCVPPLIRLLSSPDPQVAEQSAWALGNITGDSVLLRDTVIQAGIVDPLLHLSGRPDFPIGGLRTVAWTLSNLCRYKAPLVAFDVVKKLLPVLAVLIHHPDTPVVGDVCWALAYISDGDEDRIGLILSAGILDRLIQLASGTEMSLIAPSLRCLGNIVTGDDDQTQAVIDHGVLNTVVPVALTANKAALAREACWLLSNIAAGKKTQVQAVLDSGILDKIIQLLDKGEFRVKVEACWIIYNICSGGTIQQSVHLLQMGALTGVCHLLKEKESRVLILAMDTLGLMLTIAGKVGHLEAAVTLVEECEGLDQIEQLQNHENEDVYQKALQLVEQYFSETEEVGAGDGPLQFENPPEAPTGGFNF